MDLQAFAPVEPDGWATGYCSLSAESDEGEWGHVRLEWGSTYDDDEGYPREMMDMKVGVRMVESISWSVVHEERAVVVEEMERALSAR